MSDSLRPDAFAAYLGAEVTRGEDGCAQARLEITENHLNPHGTAHGVLVYAVCGVALAAAANSETRSGIVSGVHIDYLAPVRQGDVLVASVEVADANAKEDVFTGRIVRLGDGQDVADVVVARVSARATRRTRA